MSIDSELVTEFVEAIGHENIELLGSDGFLFSELKNCIPMGPTKPDFSTLPVCERLDFPHEKQVAGEHLFKFLQSVLDRFQSLVGKVDPYWILAGDGATENAYRVPKESLVRALEVFVLHPNSVIAVQTNYKAGIFIDMTWSATIFSTDR